MGLEWPARSNSLAWSNPVARWWGLLAAARQQALAWAVCMRFISGFLSGSDFDGFGFRGFAGGGRAFLGGALATILGEKTAQAGFIASYCRRVDHGTAFAAYFDEACSAQPVEMKG